MLLRLICAQPRACDRYSVSHSVDHTRFVTTLGTRHQAQLHLAGCFWPSTRWEDHSIQDTALLYLRCLRQCSLHHKLRTIVLCLHKYSRHPCTLVELITILSVLDGHLRSAWMKWCEPVEEDILQVPAAPELFGCKAQSSSVSSWSYSGNCGSALP